MGEINSINEKKRKKHGRDYNISAEKVDHGCLNNGRRNASEKGSHGPNRKLFDNQIENRKPLWTIDQLIIFLALGKLSRANARKKIYDLVHAGRIPYRKAGRSLRFDPDEIDRWTRVI